MKNFTNIITNYQNQLNGGRPLAMATVIGIEGNSFRRTGVRILLNDTGQWFHAQDKGQLHNELLSKIKEIFVSQKPTILEIDTASEEGRNIGIGLGYRGVIQLFICPFFVEDVENNPIHLLEKALYQMKYSLLMTVTKVEGRADIKPGDLFLYKNKKQLSSLISKEDLINSLHDRAEQTWTKGRSALHAIELKDSNIEVFYEILTHPPHLVLFGGQYDVYPLATLAKYIGWRVSIVANPEKLRKSIVNIVDHVIPMEQANQVPIDNYTAFILMSHVFERDMTNLIAATKTEVPYIGMLGPQKRFTRMFAQLAEQGFVLAEKDKQRLHAPMGLNIGSATQEEIAIALIAEVRAFFSGRSGGFLKEWTGNVHDR